MNRKEAEDYIYASYMRAEKYQNFNEEDKEKRNPEISKEILESLSIKPAVLVTGSKGKGSVSKILETILKTELNVGMMTSPHILKFNERIKINGEDISDKDFIYYTEKVKNYFDPIEKKLPENVGISPMAIQSAIALSYFNDNNTDINIFELGKGAKYDDVNNIKGKYGIINSVFLEHTRELGSTLEKIGENKSYLIKNCMETVFIGKQEKSVLDIFIERGKRENVNLKIYGKDFVEKNVRQSEKGIYFDGIIDGEEIKDIFIPLMGEHQSRNGILALALAKEILKTFDIENIKENLSKLKWPGRLEILSKEPFIMLDASINRESVPQVLEVMANLNIKDFIAIVGIPDDKDFFGVVKELSKKTNRIILTKSSNPHYVFTKIQKEKLKEEDINCLETNSLKEALKLGYSYDKPILILGTTSLITDAKNIFK